MNESFLFKVLFIPLYKVLFIPRKIKIYFFSEGKKNNKKKKFPETADDRVAHEMQKVALFQARLAKRKQRPKKIKTVSDYESSSQATSKCASETYFSAILIYFQCHRFETQSFRLLF